MKEGFRWGGAFEVKQDRLEWLMSKLEDTSYSFWVLELRYYPKQRKDKDARKSRGHSIYLLHTFLLPDLIAIPCQVR